MLKDAGDPVFYRAPKPSPVEVFVVLQRFVVGLRSLGANRKDGSLQMAHAKAARDLQRARRFRISSFYRVQQYRVPGLAIRTRAHRQRPNTYKQTRGNTAS